MKHPELPGGISDAVGGVLSATRALIAATAAGDPDGIHRAIDRRGLAVDQLRLELAEAGDSLSRTARHRVLESLATQAQDASDDLADLQDRVRDDLRSMADGVRAVRGYVNGGGGGRGTVDPSSLDRSS